jgi:hypothetical protein
MYVCVCRCICLPMEVRGQPLKGRAFYLPSQLSRPPMFAVTILRFVELYVYGYTTFMYVCTPCVFSACGHQKKQSFIKNSVQQLPRSFLHPDLLSRNSHFMRHGIFLIQRFQIKQFISCLPSLVPSRSRSRVQAGATSPGGSI